MISTRTAIWLMALAAAVIAVIATLLPPIPQPQWYHMFANQRAFFGIPNFNDVFSNLPFAIVGLWRLLFLFQSKSICTDLQGIASQSRGGPGHTR